MLTHQSTRRAVFVCFFLLRGEGFGDFGRLGEGYEGGVGVGGGRGHFWVWVGCLFLLVGGWWCLVGSIRFFEMGWFEGLVGWVVAVVVGGWRIGGVESFALDLRDGLWFADVLLPVRCLCD